MDRKLLDIILVLVLAMIAMVVAIGQYLHVNMWASIVAYWVVLTVKNVNNLADLIHKKKYPEAPNPFYLQRKGTPEYVGPFWTYDKAIAYAENDKVHKYRLMADVSDIKRVMDGDDDEHGEVSSIRTWRSK